MRNTMLCLLLMMVCACHLVAQEWVEVALDERFMVQLPEGYIRQDSVGQTYLIGQSENFGFVAAFRLFSKEALRQSLIRNDEELREAYDSTLSGLVTQGSRVGLFVESHQIIDWNGLMVLFTRNRRMFEGKPVIQDMWQFIFNDATYIFSANATEQIAQDPLLDAEKDKFFNGISLRESLTRKDQYHGHSLSFTIGRFVGNMFPFVLGGIVVGIVLWIQWRKKRQEARTATNAQRTNSD